MNAIEERKPSSPGISTSGDAERFVTFIMGSNIYGLRSSEVAEISHPLPITPLPLTNKFIQGIAPLHGEVVVVIDLRQLLSETAPGISSRPKFVVLSSVPEECPVAFAVDGISDLLPASFPVENVSSEIIRGSLSGHLKGIVKNGEAAIRMIDLKPTLAHAFNSDNKLF